jgi:hypothetical protein
MRAAWANTGKAADLMTKGKSSNPRIGIIAEDLTDVDCLKILIQKIAVGKTPVLKGRGTNGGGNMLRIETMKKWIRSLYDEECRYLVVVHDLDRNTVSNELNNENELRAKVEKCLADSPISKKCIVIPIQELEAWLLSDISDRPQTVVNPKEQFKKKDRNYRTSDNAKIAKRMDVSLILSRCPSFRPLQNFIVGIQ